MNFLDGFYKNIKTSDFMKICLVGAELFHAVGQTDKTKLIVVFRKFANPLKRKQFLIVPSCVVIYLGESHGRQLHFDMSLARNSNNMKVFV